MTYFCGPSVQVTAWVRMDDSSEITYEVDPAEGTVEFTLGGCDELAVRTTETSLRRCVAAFTSALDALEATTASQLDVAPADLVPPVASPTDRADG